MKEDKVECRTPAKGRDGVTRIPKWKYDLVHRHLLDVVGDAGDDGILFSSMKEAVKARLTDEQAAKLGSAGWHVTVVKLNMEVAGELKRLPGGGPQRVILGKLSQDYA